MNNGPGVSVNSRCRRSSTNPAPSQAAHEYRPEPAWRYGVCRSEVIREVIGFDSEVSTKTIGGKAGGACESRWNAYYGWVVLAFDAIGRSGSHL